MSNKELIAFSKHPRDVNSPDADHIYKRRESEKDNRMYLFVRKIRTIEKPSFIS